MNTRFRVKIHEYELGFGRRTYNRDFKSIEEAQEFITSVNSENIETVVPDTYWTADAFIEAVSTE